MIVLAFVIGLLIGGIIATVLVCACVWGYRSGEFRA